MNRTQGAHEWPAAWSAEEVVRTYSTNRVESHVHALIMRKCATLDAAFYESPRYLDMLERAVRGALMNSLSFMWGFYFLLSAATSLVATLAILSTIHWAIPVAMVVSALPQLIATSHFSRRGWALENSLATHYRLLKYLTGLISERQAASEVRLFGLSDYFVPRFREINADRLRREQSFTRKSTLWRASLGLAADAVVAGVWVFIAVRALARLISVGDVVLGTQAAWRGKQALEATFSYGGQFFEQSLALVNLFAFLDLDPASVPGSLWRPAGATRRSLPATIDSIEFRHVGFAYPAAGREVLDDVTFTIAGGEKVALPQGYETFLGGQFGIGRDLSGGQWQKVGLARGFMRCGSLFILDEPTAHLDALAEFDVFRSFLEATAGLTAVMISHRFSNVRLADHIVVLQSGRVVQEGTHAELVEADGLYARMFAAQAGGYR